MSWKIYEGITISGIETLQDAQDFVNSLRQPITEILHKQIAKQVKQMACLIYDLHHSFDIDQFDEKDKDRVPLLAASVNIIMGDREEDTEYSIGIVSLEGHTLGIPFCLNNRECLEFVIEHPQIKAFGYWDNSDPDKNVSDKEWRLRGRLWKKVFEHGHTPNQVMMISSLANTRAMVPPDELMKEPPPLEEREEACINHIAMMRASPNWTREEGVTALLRAVNDLKGDIRSEVEGKLQKNLRIKDLEQKIPEKENNSGSEGLSEAGSEDGDAA